MNRNDDERHAQEAARRGDDGDANPRGLADCPYCRKANEGVRSGTAHRCRHCGETFYASDQ